MSKTENISILKRLLKKKPVVFSLFILGILVITSSFAYLLIPDNTPYGNNQQLEIALKKPGFKTQILSIQTKVKADSKSWVEKMIYGFPKAEIDYPFQSYKLVDNQIILLNHFGQEKYFSLEELPTKDVSSLLSTQSFLLGTDKFGRDIFSRLILGIRLSLIIGFMSVLISLLIGITIGALGGFYGKWVDKIVMYLINVTWSIPTLLLVFAIVIAFGRGMWIIFLAVGLTLWVDVARLVRGQVLQIKEEEFIIATKSLSYSTSRIIRSHILPNIIGPLIVIAATNFAIAILIEAGLSYLGFGIQPPSPSVGNMLNENYGYAISGKPFLAFIPAFTIMLMVLSFNLIGSGLRDTLDVKSH